MQKRKWKDTCGLFVLWWLFSNFFFPFSGPQQLLQQQLMALQAQSNPLLQHAGLQQNSFQQANLQQASLQAQLQLQLQQNMANHNFSAQNLTNSAQNQLSSQTLTQNLTQTLNAQLSNNSQLSANQLTGQLTSNQLNAQNMTSLGNMANGNSMATGNSFLNLQLAQQQATAFALQNSQAQVAAVMGAGGQHHHPMFGLIGPDGRRKNATRESTQALKQWLNEHRKNPYPTKAEKVMLALVSRMTLTQVRKIR